MTGLRAAPLLAAALALLLLAVPLAAQEEEPPENWRIGFDLGFNGASGNSSFAVLNTGFALTHLREELAEFETGVQYRYGESEGEVIARNVRGNIKMDLNSMGRWTPFVFGTALRDRLRRTDLRSNGGAGAKYTFWVDGEDQAALSLAAIYNYENFSSTPTAPAPGAEQTARWSWRFKGRKGLGSGVTLQNVSFYQPVVNRLGDYFVDVVTAATIDMWSGISLKIEHQYQHEETPPPDVLRDDNALTVGLRFVF